MSIITHSGYDDGLVHKVMAAYYDIVRYHNNKGYIPTFTEIFEEYAVREIENNLTNQGFLNDFERYNKVEATFNDMYSDYFDQRNAICQSNAEIYNLLITRHVLFIYDGEIHNAPQQSCW